MNERASRVFMVATANDIARLPPELLRKGRFYEIFFIDLPGAASREQILRIHLGRNKQDAAAFDLARLVARCEGFSGAEIEQAIVAALYEAHAAKRNLDTDAVEQELKRTRPLSVVMSEKVAELREWARERTVPAD
jgi:SpoVK/Ycf46/Vps4 family AAA+-type ATPase